MTPEEFKQILSKKEIQLSEQQMAQFARYFELLVEWNEKMNLTAITDKQEVYLKHFYDSVSLAFLKIFQRTRQSVMLVQVLVSLVFR